MFDLVERVILRGLADAPGHFVDVFLVLLKYLVHNQQDHPGVALHLAKILHALLHQPNDRSRISMILTIIRVCKLLLLLDQKFVRDTQNPAQTGHERSILLSRNNISKIIGRSQDEPQISLVRYVVAFLVRLSQVCSNENLIAQHTHLVVEVDEVLQTVAEVREVFFADDALVRDREPVAL